MSRLSHLPDCIMTTTPISTSANGMVTWLRDMVLSGATFHWNNKRLNSHVGFHFKTVPLLAVYVDILVWLVEMLVTFSYFDIYSPGGGTMNWWELEEAGNFKQAHIGLYRGIIWRYFTRSRASVAKKTRIYATAVAFTTCVLPVLRKLKVEHTYSIQTRIKSVTNGTFGNTLLRYTKH